MSKIVCFGEIMMRLNPENSLRFVQANNFEISYSGSEANVCVSLANYDAQVSFVSKVPENPLGQSAINELRKYGVDTQYVIQGGNRLGLYFLEKGVSQRASKVIYDRKNSSFSESQSNDYDWDKIFSDANWFHFSGITPAVSKNVAEICLTACKKAKEKGITVSCDLNYRKTLWDKTQANSVMSDLFQYVDVCIANEEDIQNVFGLSAEKTDVEQGKLDISNYEDLAKQIINKFNCKYVAFTLRKSFSASNNDWSGMIISKDSTYKAKDYSINIVDRVGAGDSFSGMLIYAMTKGYSMQDSIEYATAASCLKQTIQNDFNHTLLSEVESLVKGNSAGRIMR